MTRHPPAGTATLREGLAEVWSEPRTRIFTLFVFLSMTAYFMQELILEPYAGLVFGFTPGQSTALSGAQNGGVFVGMAGRRHRRRAAPPRHPAASGSPADACSRPRRLP